MTRVLVSACGLSSITWKTVLLHPTPQKGCLVTVHYWVPFRPPAGVVLDSSEFNSQVTLANNQLVCHLPAGILDHAMLIYIAFVSTGTDKPSVGVITWNIWFNYTRVNKTILLFNTWEGEQDVIEQFKWGLSLIKTCPGTLQSKNINVQRIPSQRIPCSLYLLRNASQFTPSYSEKNPEKNNIIDAIKKVHHQKQN